MTEPTTIAIDESRLAALIDMRQRTTEALAQWNTAKETAKDKHKAYESARQTFEREFDRLMRAAKGEELPLFANQSQAIEAAQSDPITSTLVAGLLKRGHDVNAIIVHGYTDAERTAVGEYLARMVENDLRIERANGEPVELLAIEVPAFLTPQPLTPVEIADLIGRLKSAGYDDVEPDEIEAWSFAELAEVRHYLTECERIKGRLGDACTFDDLPKAPAFLQTDEDADADEDAEAESQAAEA